MDNLFEIGDLGIVRDIPAELAQLESANKVLRTKLQRQTKISNILKFCLIGMIIYVVVKAPPFKQKDK
jgi:hypothetical protein